MPQNLRIHGTGSRSGQSELDITSPISSPLPSKQLTAGIRGAAAVLPTPAELSQAMLAHIMSDTGRSAPGSDIGANIPANGRSGQAAATAAATGRHQQATALSPLANGSNSEFRRNAAAAAAGEALADSSSGHLPADNRGTQGSISQLLPPARSASPCPPPAGCGSVGELQQSPVAQAVASGGMCLRWPRGLLKSAPGTIGTGGGGGSGGVWKGPTGQSGVVSTDNLSPTRARVLNSPVSARATPHPPDLMVATPHRRISVGASGSGMPSRQGLTITRQFVQGRDRPAPTPPPPRGLQHQRIQLTSQAAAACSTNELAVTAAASAAAIAALTEWEPGRSASPGGTAAAAAAASLPPASPRTTNRH